MQPRTFVALVCALLALLTQRASATVYISRHRRRQRLQEYARAAQQAGMPADAIDCLVSAGMDVPTTRRMLGGRMTDAVDFDLMSETVIKALGRCVDGWQADTDAGVSRHSVVRRVPLRTNSHIVGQVARWFGLSETVRDICTCSNGCHYCCIQRGLSDLDLCFWYYCYGVEDVYCM